MTIEEKLTAVMLKLKNVRPFYSAIYSQLPKKVLPKEAPMQTMAVGPKELWYSEEFIKETPMNELMFVNMHEIYHIAMMHSLRREKRHPIIWNYACDYYINSALSSELSIQPGGKTVVNGVEIKFPNGLLFDSKVNVQTQSAETIYDNIKDNFKFSATDGKSWFVQDPDTGEWKEVDKSSQSKGIGDSNGFDLIPVQGASGEASEIEKKNMIESVKEILIRADTKCRMAGVGECHMQREVAKILAPKVDWKKLVKKYLIEEVSKTSSLSTPDKRMMYQDAIMPGFDGKDKTCLQRVKIGIDTSGSISAEDLGIFHAQIAQLLQKYKVGAEVLYWDSGIEGKGKFDNKQTFIKLKPMGGGGTSPECVFAYFESRECKEKPAFTIMFTDGFFSCEPIKKYAKKYKDTIWVITPYGDNSFEAPFGKTVKFDNYR